MLGVIVQQAHRFAEGDKVRLVADPAMTGFVAGIIGGRYFVHWANGHHYIYAGIMLEPLS